LIWSQVELHQRVPGHGVTASIALLRQADWLPIYELPVVKNRTFAPRSTPRGVVIISQTCDIVRQDTADIQVAQLLELDNDAATEVRAGKRPRYAAVPALGPRAFADLSIVGSVDKTDPSLVNAVRGVITDEEVRLFSGSVGRKFSRFAFPDEVVPWLQPLQAVVRSKSTKPDSPEGIVFGRVAELRIEAEGGWTVAPYDLALIIILEPGELPLLEDEELSTPPAGFMETTQPANRAVLTAGQIAALLLKESRPAWRYHLWMRLGDLWAAQCVPSEAWLRKQTDGEQGAVRAAVRGAVTAEVLMTDEYTLDRYRRSEQLDLDHLSPPYPL
jgi:hypothetical protein